MSDVRWKIDGYQEWLARQNVPVVSGLAVDLMTIETAWWPQLGANTAFVHLDARGDYGNLYLCDLAPGGATAPQRHLYEVVWHQHFNVSDQPARYLAIGFGSFRYPFLRENLEVLERTYTTKSEFQIDYEDEDPAIPRQFDAECAAWLERAGRTGA